MDRALLFGASVFHPLICASGSADQRLLITSKGRGFDSRRSHPFSIMNSVILGLSSNGKILVLHTSHEGSTPFISTIRMRPWLDEHRPHQPTVVIRIYLTHILRGCSSAVEHAFRSSRFSPTHLRKRVDRSTVIDYHSKVAGSNPAVSTIFKYTQQSLLGAVI